MQAARQTAATGGSGDHRPRRAAALLFAAWLLGTGYAFWYYQFSNLRPFNADAPQGEAFFDGKTLSGRLGALDFSTAETATLIHFWNPACPCTRFNDAHVRSLVEQYGFRGVQVLVVPAPGTPAPPPQALQARYGRPVQLASPELRALRPPSSPAVAVVDRRRELAYFGPYSLDSACSPAGGGFVEATLDNLLAGRRSRQINTLAFGCYCPWPKR